MSTRWSIGRKSWRIKEQLPSVPMFWLCSLIACPRRHSSAPSQTHSASCRTWQASITSASSTRLARTRCLIWCLCCRAWRLSFFWAKKMFHRRSTIFLSFGRTSVRGKLETWTTQNFLFFLSLNRYLSLFLIKNSDFFKNTFLN